ncbi:MAG: SoxR reducing system RseC family protein, partial [Firmicutes bacterium]|nr:SoxR reducing system RseC family protein [Candidatus Caballimonas caccae]
MIESGVVVKKDKNTATVKIDKKDECSKCGMCLFPKNANSIEINAVDNIGVSVGDTVIVNSSEKAKLLGVLLVFLVPLVLIGIALTLSLVLLNNEIVALVS